MLEAAIIGRDRSTPGLFSMRRRIRRLRRFSWLWTLAFTRRPPGGERTRLVKYLDCSPKPGGFRVSQLRTDWGYAWLRTSFNAATAVRPWKTRPRRRRAAPASRFNAATA